MMRSGKSVVQHAFLFISLCMMINRANAQKDTFFIKIPAGEYVLGNAVHQLNPLRTVKVAAYAIAATEVTNRQFELFVNATNYKTDAERHKNAMVFEPGLEEFKWLEDNTAYWRYPNGITRGDIINKMDHPVTSISYNDIIAYCTWKKVRLPTLDEWEIASRAGAKTTYFWGADREEIGKYANIWHGQNHLISDQTDGFVYTSPVASFAPNAYGIYDIYGNVFEFCEGTLKTDPKDRKIAHARGGSWWCSKNACSFFNSVDIGRINPRASFSNQGFRVVKIN